MLDVKLSILEYERLKGLAYRELVCEMHDYSRIDKVLKVLTKGVNSNTYWDEVKKLTKNIKSDHSIKRWQIIAEWFYGKAWGY